MSDLIERLRDKKRLRAAHGLTGWVLADESLHTEAADEIERLTAALQHEADCVEAAKEEIERLTAALQYEQHRAGRQGTHGDGCADWGPEHYECAIRERDELRRQLAEAEQDARRYRWLRGGKEIPAHSTRWARWDVRYWNGRYWNTMFAEELDPAIDAAMGASNE